MTKMPTASSARAYASFLTAPREGYRVWYQMEPYGDNTWFFRWYHSLKAAKASRTRMEVINPVIIGADGTVI